MQALLDFFHQKSLDGQPVILLFKRASEKKLELKMSTLLSSIPKG